MPDFSGLTPQMWFVLVLLISTVILSLLNWLRPDVLAMLILVTIGASQLLEPEQLFSGFSSDAVIALMAVMILSAGLEKSGITTCVSRWILKISREHPNKIMALLMITSGALASFLRSLGTVALFLPIVSRIHARTSISKSRSHLQNRNRTLRHPTDCEGDVPSALAAASERVPGKKEPGSPPRFH